MFVCVCVCVCVRAYCVVTCDCPHVTNVYYVGTYKLRFNPLTPNDPYMGPTAPLTSRRCILYIYSTNTRTEYFKHAAHSPFFFFLFKMPFML
jgi:hypothetical protein